MPTYRWTVRKLLFAVYRADSIINQKSRGYTYPIRSLSKSDNKSELLEYDIETGSIAALKLHRGQQERARVYLPGGKLMLPATGINSTRHFANIGAGETTTPRLFISDADGSNAVAVGPHSMAGTMHPYLLANGRIAETTKWMTHNLPYIYNNGWNCPTTTGNMWILQDVDQRRVINGTLWIAPQRLERSDYRAAYKL